MNYTGYSYASIRAIETKSVGDDQQWLTYWVLYSMITLFELTFYQLIEWYHILTLTLTNTLNSIPSVPTDLRRFYLKMCTFSVTYVSRFENIYILHQDA